MSCSNVSLGGFAIPLAESSIDITIPRPGTLVPLDIKRRGTYGNTEAVPTKQ